MPDQLPGPDDQPQPLESWKAIAAYLKRDVRTVIRWEKSEGLPVHRHRHLARSSVYAYAHELDAWRDRRRVVDDAEPAFGRGRAVGLLTFAAALAIAVVSVGDSRLMGKVPLQSGTINRLLWNSNVDILGAPSSDGRYVAMTDWLTGNLAIRDVATGAMRPLSNNGDWNGFAQFPVPSPDGSLIAYTWFNERSQFDLRIFSFAESASRVVVPARDDLYQGRVFGWTPDGRQILATLQRTDGTTDVATVGASDGSVRILKTIAAHLPERFSVSPDGRFVAFDAPQLQRSRERDIFVRSLQGGDEEPAVRHPGDDVLIGWSPDGGRLLFKSDRTGHAALWAVSIADGKPADAPQVLRSDMPLGFTTMGMTREGALFYGVRTGVSDVYTASLDLQSGAVVSPPTSIVQRFVGWNRSPDWSADGRSLAYVSYRETPARAAISITGTIIIRSVADGREREVVPKLTQMARLVRWSPNGRSFLVHGRDAQGSTGFFRVDARTGDASLVLPEGGKDRPGYLQAQSWAPDGKSMFYLRTTPEASNHLRVRNLQTGEDREVYGAPTNVYAVSPDGRRVAVRAPGDANAAHGLALAPVQGGSPQTLFRLGNRLRIPPFSALAWTPDGARILFAVATEGTNQPFELWSAPSAGGTPQKTGIAMEGLRDLRIGRDGRQLVFGAGQNRQEIWVMENFLPR